MKTKLILVAAALLLAGACSTPAPRSNEALQVSETSSAYKLSVPVSQLAMTLPRGNWSHKDKSPLGGGTSNPRYFYFEDQKEESLILSGWFEPDRLFTGSAAKQWEKDLPGLKKAKLPPPVNIAFERVGGWDTVMYDQVFSGIVSSHMRAHWVQAGTWIDLHLSTTSERSSAENRRKLKALVRAISVTEKGNGCKNALCSAKASIGAGNRRSAG